MRQRRISHLRLSSLDQTVLRPSNVVNPTDRAHVAIMRQSGQSVRVRRSSACGFNDEAPSRKAPFGMIDEFAKEYLHSDLRDARATMLWKLEGLGEYDVRRPMTPTGTNLLGLIKHLTITEAWYFGEVFGRPFPERLPWQDNDTDARSDDAKLAALFDYKLQLADMWATEHES